jgi:hypothetical protein
LTARPVNNLDNRHAERPVVVRRHAPQSPPFIPVSALRTKQRGSAGHRPNVAGTESRPSNESITFQELPQLTDDMQSDMENYLPPEYSKLSPPIHWNCEQGDLQKVEQQTIRLHAVPVPEALYSPYRKASSPRVNSLLPHYQPQPALHPNAERHEAIPTDGDIDAIQIQARPILDSPRVQTDIRGLTDSSGNAASGLSDR